MNSAFNFIVDKFGSEPLEYVYFSVLNKYLLFSGQVVFDSETCLRLLKLEPNLQYSGLGHHYFVACFPSQFLVSLVFARFKINVL